VDYARVSTYSFPLEQVDEAARSFEEAAERIRSLEGLKDVYVLLDAEQGQAITVTVWDGRTTLESSRVAASRARSEAAREVDGEVQTVREYIVALHASGSV
jgi:heme-degrading monooxygenase HmoA